jgi:putative phage-type endonuclease
MLINQDFSVDRTKYIGGSDIGAILGLSKFKTPLEVWMEKTGKQTKQMDSLPLRFGSFAEEFVAQEYTRSSGHSLVHDESIYIHPQHSYMSAHIDRFVLGEGSDRPPTRILECKTASPFNQDQWGEPGSDQVPMSYLCQCIWYMAITQIEVTDLAVLFGNSDFRIYTLKRDLDLEALVLKQASHFWNTYVLPDCPPPTQSEADCQLLFKQSIPAKTTEASSQTQDLVSRLLELNQHMKTVEIQMSEIKQQLMNQMGDSEQLCYQGQVLATWKAPKPSYRLDAKSLEQDHPKLYEQYKLPIQNSRRFVIKEPSAQ